MSFTDNFVHAVLGAAALFLSFSGTLSAQRVDSDCWAATDALGRKVRSREDTGGKRDGKFVAMFYWTWHQGDTDTTFQVKNISEIIRKHPEAMKDYGHPAWGDRKPGSFYWEQPLFGYYRTTDKWVLRKHAEMLADAGVDAVFFDCTNGSLTWTESCEALMETWDQAQRDGVEVPRIAFMLPFWPTPESRVSLRQLYKDVYKPGRYANLWFVWKGRPCIMAHPEVLTDDPVDREIAGFFTFRPGQPDYVNGPATDKDWGWLENYPQHGYVPATGPDGKVSYEEVTVGVAQNTSPARNGHCGAFNVPDPYSRSFSVRNGRDPRPDGYLYGWNFQEQWERAFELDPELVFVTGWNEYTAGMWLPKDGWNGEPFSFVDEFNWDCSRDIEPNKGWGDKGDVYYLQLVDNVRRFKGMNRQEPASPVKRIRLRKRSDWDDVAPFYASYKGNTAHRDCPGKFDSYYADDSGRNDIVGAKVARDSKYVYFYVETAGKLSPRTDPNWMMLFLDVDRDKTTGWNGYDYVLNRTRPDGNKAVLEKNRKGMWWWEREAGCRIAVLGNVLTVRIPRKALGLADGPLDFEFKWNDNMQREGDIMDFYVSGDTAPGGRFNYVYRTEE